MISMRPRILISMLLILASTGGCNTPQQATTDAPVEAEPVASQAAKQESPPVVSGVDPRARQREMLAAAEALLPPGTSQLSLEEAQALEQSLRAQLAGAANKDTIYLALALFYEFHSPDAAFEAQVDGPGAGVLDDGRSRARVSAAIAVLEQAVAANPANTASLWQLALLQENLDDKVAVQSWQALVSHAPGHLQALTRLGEGQILLEQHEQAIETGERALSIATSRSDEQEAGRARNILGRAYLHQRRYEEAEEMFKNAAVRTDGSHWGCAYQSLGQLYATLGEADLPTMEAADPRRAMSAALSAYQQDDYSGALEHIESALSSSSRPELQGMRSFLLMFTGNDEQARSMFSQAATARPDDPGPGTGLAHLELFAGRPDRARHYLQPALRSWHQTSLSKTDFPRYYAFIHRLACMANGRLSQQSSASKTQVVSETDAELARVVCAMDLGFSAGPDAPEPAWINRSQ